ncbi:MAG: hypothetical protein MZV64_35020 [Ignavibacteriales bacterium]|nr:hypothetical protein [Ignavibacteriales bacterium]
MGTMPGGVNKRDYLDYQIRSSLVGGLALRPDRHGTRRGGGMLLRGQP